MGALSPPVEKEDLFCHSVVSVCDVGRPAVLFGDSRCSSVCLGGLVWPKYLLESLSTASSWFDQTEVTKEPLQNSAGSTSGSRGAHLGVGTGEG